MADTPVDRRKFLYGTAVAGVTGLAGCSGGGGSGGESEESSDSGGDGGGSDSGSDAGSDSGSEESSSEESESLELRVGTSAGGTRDVGLAVERAVSQESDTLNYSTIESPGYIGTIYRMAQNQFNAGITDNNSLNKALNDEGQFAEQSVSRIPYSRTSRRSTTSPARTSTPRSRATRRVGPPSTSGHKSPPRTSTSR
jgi:hypothetical protein